MADNLEECGALPQVTFSTFIISMASSVLVHLGEVPNPATGGKEKDPVLAKHGIDTLAMLEDKIRNGLSQDEKSLLGSVLYELRMKYVCLCEKDR